MPKMWNRILSYRKYINVELIFFRWKKICRRYDKFCIVCHFNKCIFCDDDKYLSEGKISVYECLFGFVKNNNQWVKCNTLKNCKKCDGKDSRKCGECIEPEIEFMGHCVNKCPEKYFQNSGRCERCFVGCKIVHVIKCKICVFENFW